MYFIVKATNTYGIYDQDKGCIAPITNFEYASKMYQQCLDGNDCHAWTPVTDFKSAFGEWSIMDIGHRELDIRLKDSPYSMATITEGEHAGRDVQVQLEFADGFCIVDIGHPLIIHRVCLRFWVSTKKFVIKNGQVWVDVLNEA